MLLDLKMFLSLDPFCKPCILAPSVNTGHSYVWVAAIFVQLHSVALYVNRKIPHDLTKALRMYKLHAYIASVADDHMHFINIPTDMHIKFQARPRIALDTGRWEEKRPEDIKENKRYSALKQEAARDDADEISAIMAA